MKRKDSLEIRAVLIEISLILKFTKRPKMSGITLKTMAFSEANHRSSQRRCSIEKGALKNFEFLRLRLFLQNTSGRLHLETAICT